MQNFFVEYGGFSNAMITTGVDFKELTDSVCLVVRLVDDIPSRRFEVGFLPTPSTSATIPVLLVQNGVILFPSILFVRSWRWLCYSSAQSESSRIHHQLYPFLLTHTSQHVTSSDIFILFRFVYSLLQMKSFVLAWMETDVVVPQSTIVVHPHPF